MSLFHNQCRTWSKIISELLPCLESSLSKYSLRFYPIKQQQQQQQHIGRHSFLVNKFHEFFTISLVTSFTSGVQMTGKQNQSGYPEEHMCKRSDIIKYFHTLEANVQARYREKLVKSTTVAMIACHLPIRFTGCDVYI